MPLNQSTATPKAFSIRAMADPDAEVRTETFMGKEYVVVPVVALVEGVIQGMNSPTPELALAEEFGKVPQGWDGRPVVMNHPVMNGAPVSANSPAALEQFQMGMLFNTIVEDKKLKTEAWLDTARIAEQGGDFASTLKRVQDGIVVEVSTGLFTGIEQVQGRFNGRDYAAVWRDVTPDHLAFLSEGTIGACSIDDGCGTPRINTSTNLKVHSSALTWQECGCKHGGNEVPAPSLIADLEAAGVNTPAAPTVLSAPPAPAPTPAPEAPKVHTFDVARLVANQYPDTMMDSDVRQLVNEAIRSQANDYAWVIGFTKELVVYEAYDNKTGQYLCYQRSFTIGADNAVTLGDDVTRVNITMKVDPVAKTNEAVTTPPTVNSEDETMPTTVVTPETPAVVVAPVVEATAPAPAVNAAAPVVAPVPAAPRTLETYIADAPPEMQAVLNEGLKLHREKREGIIKGLKATNRSDFTDAQYAGMSLEVLESLAKLAVVPVYNGQNPAPRDISDNAAAVPPMPALIPAKVA